MSILDYLSVVITGTVFIIALMVLIGIIHASRLADIEKEKRKQVFVVSILLLTTWLLTALILGQRGFFIAEDNAVFPNIALGIILPIGAGYYFIHWSSVFGRVIKFVPNHLLIGIQFYRCLGIIFLMLNAQQKLPGIFAVPAGYGDILIGIAAPVIGYMYFKGYKWSRNLSLLWNLAGIGDLIIAVTFGFLSSPGRFQLLSLDFPNDLITSFPLVIIPTFAVPMSILLHIISLKLLVRK